MVHACHVRMIHAHISHGEPRRVSKFRYRRSQSILDRQGCPRKTRPAHRLSKNSVGLGILWLNDHIVSLRHTNSKLIHLYGLNVVPIGLNDCHFKPWNSNIEIRHRGRVNESKPNSFAGRK